MILAAPPPRGRRPAGESQRADPELSTTAAWMRQPLSRLSPAQRRQQRIDEQLLQTASGSQPAGPGDRRQAGPSGPRSPWWHTFDDPRGGVPRQPDPPWQTAWRDLRAAPSPRPHRFLAWRIMHGTLPCAARLAAWRRSAGRALGREHDPHCHHPACSAAGRLETISHIFLGCPVARQVLQWVGALYRAVWQVPLPPLSPEVWLAADTRVWDPGQGGDLWDILRLAALHHIWAARCSGRHTGRPVTALAIVAQLVHHLRDRILGDSVRAFTPLLDFAATGGEWLPDRPTLDTTEFHARWAYHGVLCTRTEPHGPLRVHLTMSHPVPPPV